MTEDFISRTIDHVALTYGFGRFFIACLVVTLVGLVLTAFRKTRLAGTIVMIVGGCLAWLVLLAVTQAQTMEKVNPNTTVFRDFYGQRTIFYAQAGMIAIPALATIAGLVGWRLAAERRRRSLPIYLKNGLKAFFQKDYDTALKEFTTAISIAPHRAESYNRRGLVHLQLGDLDKALADFDRAVDLEPENASAYRHRGMVFASRDDLELALTDFEFSLKLDITDCATILQRGICLTRLGQKDRAVEDLRRVLQLSNHSDYADPAREYLKRLGENV